MSLYEHDRWVRIQNLKQKAESYSFTENPSTDANDKVFDIRGNELGVLSKDKSRMYINGKWVDVVYEE